MEKLISLIPEDLKAMIGRSAPEDLILTCSSLIDFLRPLPDFQRVIGELTDPELALCRKSKEAALELKRKGNACFSKGEYEKALSFYSRALRAASMNPNNVDEDLIMTLFVNRASSLHKLDLSEECLRDCNRAVTISPLYSKAWYRRGKANASLQKYDIAMCDLEVALSVESSSSGMMHIKEELDMLKHYYNGSNGTGKLQATDKDNNSAVLAEQDHVALQCVTTPSKGRGMISRDNIPPAVLIHSEEPLAAIVEKSYRETHCHFCFNEVPADPLFCTSCTAPIYCSQHCQERAGGKLKRNKSSYNLKNKVSADLEIHIMDTLAAIEDEYAVKDVSSRLSSEHRHECGGAHWPVVLPTNVVLAGRLMAECLGKRHSGGTSKPSENLDFVHNFLQVPPGGKLELHICSVVLAYCLNIYYGSDFPPTGVSTSQLVIVMSQVRVNSMSIVHMISSDSHGAFTNSAMDSAIGNTHICDVEQVKVGQAIYSTGSLFNHSCQPNIHAYFISRKLFFRSTEYIQAGYPLELSYGPQVGQWDLQNRQKLLKQQYYFKCECPGCSELNLPDLVINAFRCVNPDCVGVVLRMVHFERRGYEILQFDDESNSFKLSLPRSEQDISKVAFMLLQKPGTYHIIPGHCLSCGSYLDFESSTISSERALSLIESLKDLMVSDEAPENLINESLKSLGCLRSARHQYSKIVAQAEDNIAEAFVKIGALEPAMQHCTASIEILEKLYHSNHIVIGNELMKLASIQISLGDHAAALSSIERLESIFSLYYGSHLANVLLSGGKLRSFSRYYTSF